MTGMGKVIRSGFWLYMSSVANNLGGYLYWIVISRLGGPSLLGLTSAVIGFSTVIASTLNLGVTVSAQRFIAMALGRGEPREAAGYYRALLAYTLAVYVPASLIIGVLSRFGVSVAGFTAEMLFAASVILLLQGLSLAAQAYALATLRTRLLFAATLAGNVAKFAGGVALVAAGLGWLGAVLGYALLFAFQALAVIPSSAHLMLVRAGRLFKRVIELVRTGLVVWLPNFLLVVGQWLGVLAVYGYSSAVETGHYYAASAIALFILAVSNIIVGVLIPVFSSMREGRERLARQAMRLAAALVTPLAAILFTYPELPLKLLGRDFLAAADVLRLLSLSATPAAVANVVSSLAYAYGMYRETLFLGLAQTLPRILLYVTLTPVYGALGAAAALVVGSYSGLAYAAGLWRRMGLGSYMRELALVMAPPALVYASVLAAGLPWVIGVPLYAACYIAYIRLKVISLREIGEIVRALAPERLFRHLRRLEPILHRIAGL